MNMNSKHIQATTGPSWGTELNVMTLVSGANTLGCSNFKYIRRAAGMPVLRQKLTEGGFTWQIAATEDVPPNASIISESVMRQIIS